VQRGVRVVIDEGVGGVEGVEGVEGAYVFPLARSLAERPIKPRREGTG
jgi:hypothetical protein